MSATDKIQTGNNQTLYAYWNSLRKGRKAPHRFEIEPSHIASVLPHTFILQHERVGKYDFRLAGTEICHEFCFELKQNNLLELWSHHDAETVKNILHAVEKDAAVGVVEFAATARNGEMLEYEMMVLPLYHNNMQISRMLGGMVSKSQPYWIGTSRLESFQVQKVRMFWPNKPQEDNVFHHPAYDIDTEVSPLGNTDYKIVTAKDRKFRVYEGGRDLTEA